MWKLLIKIWILGSTVSGNQLLGTFERPGGTAHSLSSGQVELLNTKTISIPNLNYDGTGPATWFIVGHGKPPPQYPESNPGYIIPNELGNCEVLKQYRGESIQLVLPGEYTVNNIDWLAVYCVEFKHTFGWVDFAGKRNGNRFQSVADSPADIVLPNACKQATRVLDIFRLKEGPTAHALKSAPIELLNSRTIRIAKLEYDGTGPDAFFMVGRGGPPNERPRSTPGHKIPNEDGSCAVLKKYSGKTVELVLPDNFTVHNIDWFGMYCIDYKHTFGWVDFKKARSGKDFGDLTPLPPNIPPPKPCGGPPTLSGSGSGLILPGILLPVFLKWTFDFIFNI